LGEAVRTLRVELVGDVKDWEEGTGSGGDGEELGDSG
jgi:hypothetical protein